MPDECDKADGLCLAHANSGATRAALELVSLDASKLQARWSLYADESGEGIWFSGLGAGGKATDYLGAKVEFTAGEWVLVTLCYGEQGSQLWLNAELVAEGKSVPAPSQWQENFLGLLIGSDLAVQRPAFGQFEEVATLDYWPDEAQQQFYFNGVKGS